MNHEYYNAACTTRGKAGGAYNEKEREREIELKTFVYSMIIILFFDWTYAVRP